jgi:hypothetical protein
MLGCLGVVDTSPGILEVSARIGHRLTQDAPVEVVRDVVVMGDRGRISLPRWAKADEPGLLWRGLGRKPDRSQPPSRPQRAHPLGGTKPDVDMPIRRAEQIPEREHLEDVAFHVDLTGDVCTSKTELARRGEDSTQRAGDRIARVARSSWEPSVLPSQK